MNLEKVTVMIVIIAVVFTVTLTQSLQIADAISVSADKLKFDIERGDTQLLYWSVRNTDPYPIALEFYATGPGAELLVFEQFGYLEIKERISYEILASIPIDHEDNVEYRPVLHVLQRSQDPNSTSNNESLGATATVNVVMKTVPIIRIGEDPIYAHPKIIPEEKVEVPKYNPALEKAPTTEEKEQVESIQQKLDRIQAANEAKTLALEPQETQEIETQEIEDKVIDDEYVPEPVMDIPPVVKPVVAEEQGGGCLIATAAFGSELAPQVQLLREIRDNQLMNSNSGIAFMSGFNSLYYSFSPYIADMERDSPIFKEMVKLTLTPMLTTLSVMEHADSEESVLGLGIGVILMNLGMYVALPTFGILKFIQIRKN